MKTIRCKYLQERNLNALSVTSDGDRRKRNCSNWKIPIPVDKHSQGGQTESSEQLLVVKATIHVPDKQL